MHRGEGNRVRRSATLSTALAIAGAVLLLVGGLALYAREALFDSDAFSRTAAKSLQDEAVRNALADPIVEQVINVGPDQLINAQPLIQGAVSGLLETNAFKRVFRDAVRKAHAALFKKDRDELVLTIQEANALVVDAVASLSPEVAKKIPNDVGQRLVRVTDSKIALTGARWARHVRFLGLVLPPLGILALIGAVLVAPQRRRGLYTSFISVAVAAAVGLVGLVAARTLLLRRFSDDGQETLHDAVAALFDNYMGGLGNWLLLLGVVAIALAGATAAGEPDPFAWPRRALGWVTRTPDSTWARAGRALAVGIAGIIAFLQPTFALQVAAVIGGSFAIYFAVVELIAAVAPAPAKGRGRGKAARATDWRVPAAAGAVIVAAAITIAVLLTNENKREAVRPAGPVKACNGHPQLCDRTLDEVAFPGAHNAMSAAELPGWYTPNQRWAIPRQLDEGIRAFLIDSHPGVKLKGGRIITDLDREGTGKVVESVREQLGPGGAERFKRLTAQAQNTDEGTPGEYFCHIVCELGSTPMTKELGWFKSFLDTHPDEVVILFVEDYVSPEETAAAFEKSGILRYAYVHRTGQPFPTLRQMIEADRRLFVMAEKDNGDGKYPWYHAGFELAQETPYTFHNAKELADPEESCIGNRGIPANPLFQLNNWVESLPRSPDTAAKVNDFEFLKRRALECDRRRGLLSNIIAVDYYNEGDVVEVSRVLNSLPRDKEPTYRETG
jgi:hypothetical protein